MMNELIIPCIHLIINNDISKDDLHAIEIMRNHWCSYLGQDIAGMLLLALAITSEAFHSFRNDSVFTLQSWLSNLFKGLLKPISELKVDLL